jgi:antitoxin component of RelBE/YafQ-DinJ toxin-antitoxin module
MNYIINIIDAVDNVEEFIVSRNSYRVIDAKMTDALISRAENVKNSFVQELDLAVKIFLLQIIACHSLPVTCRLSFQVNCVMQILDL